MSESKVLECGMRRLFLRFVYRKVELFGRTTFFEIGECHNPRLFSADWCDNRICEGFWGNEDFCRWTVDVMNAADLSRREKERENE